MTHHKHYTLYSMSITQFKKDNKSEDYIDIDIRACMNVVIIKMYN